MSVGKLHLLMKENEGTEVTSSFPTQMITNRHGGEIDLWIKHAQLQGQSTRDTELPNHSSFAICTINMLVCCGEKY